MTIEFDDFGWVGLQAEAERQSVSVEALVEHAAMYYLADLHSGRAAVQVFRRAFATRAPTRGGRFGRAPDDDGQPDE